MFDESKDVRALIQCASKFDSMTIAREAVTSVMLARLAMIALFPITTIRMTLEKVFEGLLMRVHS
jgi:hypothetical protein